MTKFLRKTWLNLYRLFVIIKINLERSLSAGENSAPVRGARKALAFTVMALVTLVRLIFRILFAVYEGVKKLFLAFKENITDDDSRVRMAWEYIEEEIHEFKYGRRPRTTACLFLVSMVVMIVSLSYFGIGVEVFIDGESYGFVDSRDEVLAVIHQVENETAEYLGRPYNLNADITYDFAYMQRDRMIDPEDLKTRLFSGLNEISTKYVLLLDGEIVGAHTSKTSLELLKQKVLEAKTPDDSEMHTTFLQEITIEERTVANSLIKTIEQMEKELMANTREVLTHSVVKGDTFSTIAEQYGISTQTLKKLNPDIEETKIQIGAEIRVAAAVPVLSVKSTQTITYTEDIAYDVEVEYSDSMYKTQSKIKQKGQVGTEEVVADVIYIDGTEVERVELSRTVIEEPVKEIKVVGTKKPPAKSATGSFRWPTSGRISSKYGYRWGGEFHNAIDIATASGTPIVAADGGTVTLAKWNGNYGYCVVIDHGNGYTTLYAHSSKLLVSKGQKVAKGEKIALVGSTGRSTGPHLHFEVKKNGRNINPYNVLP
ncbi:MAG: peptidoglycan DD-metalloendopeptidase family protein [Clostridia bacterium]|nr:peptidoglycan DD-metalloendopeptidase family protein [Clostridia bacterium]